MIRIPVAQVKMHEADHVQIIIFGNVLYVAWNEVEVLRVPCKLSFDFCDQIPKMSEFMNQSWASMKSLELAWDAD